MTKAKLISVCFLVLGSILAAAAQQGLIPDVCPPSAPQAPAYQLPSLTPAPTPHVDGDDAGVGK